MSGGQVGRWVDGCVSGQFGFRLKEEWMDEWVDELNRWTNNKQMVW